MFASDEYNHLKQSFLNKVAVWLTNPTLLITLTAFCKATMLLSVLGAAQEHIKLQLVGYGKIGELYTKYNNLVNK